MGGASLRFINAPFLDWPDSMFTWVVEEKALFSCDFLGAHYCEPYTFDYNMAYPSKYEAAFKNYYDAIFGPFKPYVLAGLEKIKDLPVELCCNSHGPVLTKGCRLEYAKERYAEWSQPQKNERLTVPVFYTSAYGNTRKIASAIREGVLEAKPDAAVDCFDVIEHDMGTRSRSAARRSTATRCRPPGCCWPTSTRSTTRKSQCSSSAPTAGAARRCPTCPPASRGSG